MGTGNEIWYIPDQSDSVAASSPTVQDNPLYLTCQDIRTLLSLCPLIPKLFLPLSTTNSTDELYMKGRNLWNMLASGAISCFELLSFPLVMIVCLVVPGGIGLLVFAVVIFLTWGICAPLEGPPIIHSSPDETPSTTALRAEESWIFINGILATFVPPSPYTGRRWLMAIQSQGIFCQAEL